MHQHLRVSSAERDEVDHIIKLRTEELVRTKDRLTDCEMELKECRYELHHLHNLQDKWREEEKLRDIEHRHTLFELRRQLEQQKSYNDNKMKAVSIECDKILQLIQGLQSSTDSSNDNNKPMVAVRTTSKLISKTFSDVKRLKAFVDSSADSLLREIATDPSTSTSLLDDNRGVTITTHYLYH